CALPILVVEEIEGQERRSVDVEHVAQQVDSGAYVTGEPPFLHQRLVEAAVAALTQDLVEYAEGEIFRRVAGRRLVADRQRGPGGLLVHARRPLLLRLPRLADVGRGRLLHGGDGTEVLLDPGPGLLRVEI